MTSVDDRDVTPVVHVGFHRTATTFLQKMVFARLEGYIESGNILNWVGEAPARSLRPGITPIYSNENICGSLVGDVDSNAKKLRFLFPRAKIIVFVRSQFYIFKSYYFLKLKGGSCESYYDFVDKHIGYLFDYFHFLSVYSSMYGAKNVRFVLFEDFVASPRDVIDDILLFAGYDPRILSELDSNRRIKPTPSDATLVALRLRNHLLLPLEIVAPQLAVKVRQFGIPASQYLSDSMIGVSDFRAEIAALRQPINDAYRSSNKQFFIEIGKDLIRYDYPK